MPHSRIRVSCLALVFALLATLYAFGPGTALAQSSGAADPVVRGVRPQSIPETEEQRLKSLEERLHALEQEIATLKGDLQAARAPATNDQTGAPRIVLASAVVPPPAEAPAAAAPQAPAVGQGEPQPAPAQLPIYGGASAMAKVLNPDISVIGNFLGAAGHNPVNPQPGLEMPESEVGLQAIVDPYARADFFLSFGESGVDLEEGYITFTSLPAGLVARAGKFRASFGRVNTFHTHVLPWADRPLVTENLLGGDEGISDAGLSVSRILPAPSGLFLEATAQVMRGDSPGVFTSTNRSDVSAVGHLRAYKDITESTNLDLGYSYARGHNDVGSPFKTQLHGIDATFRWTPLRRTIYHNFVGRAEWVWSQRNQLDVALLPERQNAFGMFASGDYRLNRRWTIGGRYDRSGQAQDASLIDTGFSTLLTYWPSEFSQIRGQYRFTRYAGNRDANELLFQILFVLGAHGAHPF
jgi:hypothetical protein